METAEGEKDKGRGFHNTKGSETVTEGGTRTGDGRGGGGKGGGKGGEGGIVHSPCLPLPQASRPSQMPDMRHLTLSSCMAFRFTAGLSLRTSSPLIPRAVVLSPSDVPFAVLHLHHVIHCLSTLLA